MDREQITARVSKAEGSAFLEYAHSLNINKTALASLLIKRELHRKSLMGQTILPQGQEVKITAHLRSGDDKARFREYAQSLNVTMGDAAAAIFRNELREQWLRGALQQDQALDSG